MRLRRKQVHRLLLVCFLSSRASSLLQAQQPVPDETPQTQTPADNGNLPATLIQPIERAANYLNFYAFFNGIYDSTTPIAGVSGSNVSGTALQVGGGVSANHDFATGALALSYRGDYRTHADPQYPGGTDQSLTFFFRKLLSRRWTFSFQENAGIFPQGEGLLAPATSSETNVLQSTPFSLNTKFTGTTAALSYAQTRRLSYEFTGTFYLTRYNAPIGFGNDDISGTGTVLYRLTRTTTLSGTYQYSKFIYQHAAGQAQSNSVYATLSHALPDHWSVGVSGGATYTSDSGTILIPVTLQIGQILFPVYEQGHYAQTATLPYIQGTVGRNWKHYVLSVSGGESTTPGNGIFLASQNLGLSGVFSYSKPRSTISAGGYFSHLKSIANASSLRVKTTDFQAQYSYNLIRHIGANARYDHIDYGTLGTQSSVSDNRISFGFYFSSKDIPLALF